MKGTKGIVAFAFGAPCTIESNKRIARIASHKAHEFGAPVYTQCDIFIEHGIEVYNCEEIESLPPPTLRIARGAVQWAQEQRLSELWIVAAQPHLWRCLRDLERAVRETEAQIKILACEEIWYYPPDGWFCLNSTQERTRYREAWDKRERILKFMPFFIYKRIGS